MRRTEPLQSQSDTGFRNNDFFEDSSDDASAHSDGPKRGEQDLISTPTKRSTSRKRFSDRSFELSNSTHGRRATVPQYQRLSQEISLEADTSSTSFNGSVDELPQGAPRSAPPVHHKQRSPRVSTGRKARSAPTIDPVETRSPVQPGSKIDSTLERYAIAHEITLQALLRDPTPIDLKFKSFSFAPLDPSQQRDSALPSSLRVRDDPRSPKSQNFSYPGNPPLPDPPAPARRVTLAPPPIDTSAQGSLPANLVRTPYPFTPEEGYRKEFDVESRLFKEPIALPAGESVLTLSIRRTNPNSKPRITTIVLPALDHTPATRDPARTKEQQDVQPPAYDDAEFFHQLRSAYSRLGGLWRFLSARSLSRIVISEPAPPSPDDSPRKGWTLQPRSPREVAHQGLIDTFSEDELRQCFRRPARGKSQYAFVHWAHRLAATTGPVPRRPPPPPPPRDATPVTATTASTATPATATPTPTPTDDRRLVRRLRQPEGLEFVVGWSARRIALVLAVIVGVGVAAALLWALLGHSSVAAGQPQEGGFRGAGDRVAAGVLLGTGVLGFGVAGMGGWIALSWLLM